MTTQLDLPGIVLIYTCGPCVVVSSVPAHSWEGPSAMRNYVLPSNKALFQRPLPPRSPVCPLVEGEEEGFCRGVCMCLGAGIVLPELGLS